MSDLKSEQVGILQLDGAGLMAHIQEVRRRRRTRLTPPRKVSTPQRKDPKKLLEKMDKKQLEELLKQALALKEAPE